MFRIMIMLMIFIVMFAIGLQVADKVFGQEHYDVNVVYNPSGTQVYNDILYIRMDYYFYEGSRIYEKRYYEDFDSEGKSLGYSLHPAFSCFMKVDRNMDDNILEAHVRDVFDDIKLNELDVCLSGDNTVHEIYPLIKDSLIVSTNKVGLKNDEAIKAVEDSINLRFENYDLLLRGEYLEDVNIAGHSIDMGAECINRGSYVSLGQYSWIDYNNDCEADGEFDTCEIWMNGSGTDVVIGSAYFVGGTTWHVRNTWDIGSVAYGYNIFAGIELEAESGDYPAIMDGTSTSGVYIERDFSTGVGYYYITGDHVVVDDESSWSWSSAQAISYYLTGEEFEDGGDSTVTQLDLISSNVALIALILGVVLIGLTFFIKSLLIYLASAVCMIAVVIEPEFNNTFIQWSAVLIMVLCVVGIVNLVRSRE